MRRDISFSEYDETFQDATNKWLPNIDWRWLKAQAYQESLFDPEAVSPAGARGIMQFMPETWLEMQDKYNDDATLSEDPFDVEASIHLGAAYMSRLINVWKRDRPKMDRYALALSSYNSGLGNIIKAQAAVGDPALYADIILGLPQITGDHSRETITYVHRIFNYYRQQVVGG